MTEDGLTTPLAFTLPPALADDGQEVVAEDRGADPLDLGFLLVGGVLAPLPARVRLPHEPDDDASGDRSGGDDEGPDPV